MIRVSQERIAAVADRLRTVSLRTSVLLAGAGEEEVTYLYVDLQQAGDIPMPAAGSSVTIQV